MTDEEREILRLLVARVAHLSELVRWLLENAGIDIEAEIEKQNKKQSEVKK